MASVLDLKKLGCETEANCDYICEKFVDTFGVTDEAARNNDAQADIEEINEIELEDEEFLEEVDEEIKKEMEEEYEERKKEKKEEYEKKKKEMEEEYEKKKKEL